MEAKKIEQYQATKNIAVEPLLDKNLQMDKPKAVVKQKVSNKTLAMVFFFTMLMNVGVYFNYDFPQLYEDIMIKRFNITPVSVEFLYSIYSFPNFITTPLGSILLSTIGLSTGIVIFNSLAFIGPVIIALGFFFNKFWIIVVGRIVFGLGGELCLIAQATISERWFSGKGLSFSQAINRTFGFLSVTSAFYFGPEFLIKTKSMEITLVLCGISSFIGFSVAVGYLFVDMGYKKAENAKIQDKQRNEVAVGQEQQEQHQEETGFKLSNIKKMGKLFWLCGTTFAIGSQIYLQFLSFATDCFVSRFAYTYEEAKDMLSLIPIFCMCLLPPTSIFVVWFGRKGFLLFMSFVMGGGSILFMRTLPPNPGSIMYLVLFFFSFYYALFVVVVWPSMTLSVPPVATAVALGLATTVQNIFITLFPFIFGYINRDRTPAQYDQSLLVIVGMAVVSGLLSILTIIVDFKTGGKLNMPENNPKVTELREEMARDFRSETVAKDAGDDYQSLGTKSRTTDAKTFRDEDVIAE